jgi:hypothetical protein
MKYLTNGIIIIVFAAIYFVYLYIPSRIDVKVLENFPKSAYGEKGIVQVQYWDKWMPYKQKNDKPKIYTFENCELRVDKGGIVDNAKSILVINDIKTKLTISTVYDPEKASTAVYYDYQIDNSTMNPIKRIQNYYAAKKLDKQIKEIMQAAKVYYSKQQ